MRSYTIHGNLMLKTRPFGLGLGMGWHGLTHPILIHPTGKFIGQEATQQMYPKSKKFIIKDYDELSKEINLTRKGRRPSGERAGIDVPDMPEGFKLSREKLEQNFPEGGGFSSCKHFSNSTRISSI